MLNYLCQDDFSGKVVNWAQPWLINPLRTYCHVSAGWKINFVNYAEWCWFALTATFPLKLGQEKKNTSVFCFYFSLHLNYANSRQPRPQKERQTRSVLGLSVAEFLETFL